MVKTKVTVAILVLALALFIPFAIQAKPTPTPPGQHLNITQVFVDVPPGQITINGTDLDFGPGPLVVTLGNFGELLNCSGDDMTIVCDLPKGILKGDYLLTVSNGNGQSQGDEYDLTICSDLAACFDASNYFEDSIGFIADCILSAGCPDAEVNCNWIVDTSKACKNCIENGKDCDECNEQMTTDLECTNVCEGEEQCFDASNYFEDSIGFIADCEEIADCEDMELCEKFASDADVCEGCIETGDEERCAACNKAMGNRCDNICASGGGGPIIVPILPK